MMSFIRSYLLRRDRLRKLRVEHARLVTHRRALVDVGRGDAALALALQQTDLQLAAVEHDIRLVTQGISESR